MNRKEFGCWLRAQREARMPPMQMSVRQLASQAVICPTYLSRIERGECPPPQPEVLCRIADALSIDALTLIKYAERIPEAIERASRALDETTQEQVLRSILDMGGRL